MSITCRYSEEEKKQYEEVMGIPFDTLWNAALENLRKAGCSEKGIQFVMNYGGLINAYKSDFGSQAQYFGTDLEGYVIEYMTTD